MVVSGHKAQGGTVERVVYDRLVEAAEMLFCARGFNEARVRDIAAAADCHIASVKYYFGGKENLYVEVWHRHLARPRDVRLASTEKVMSLDGEPRVEHVARFSAGGIDTYRTDSGDQG
jgi:AcrR family transcriptional regulator